MTKASVPKNTQGEHDPEDIPPAVMQPPLPEVHAVETVKEYDPQKDLLAVRNVRARIVTFYGSRGVPADLREVEALRGILKDMDSSALGQMRIKVDEKTAELGEQQRLAAIAVLGHLSDIKRSGQPMELLTGATREVPMLPDDVESRPFVPGEAEQGTVNQTFEDFQNRTGAVDLAEEDKD
jgi:hypothetical protein